MKKGTKVFVAALALVLVFGAVVGGTLAWLQAKTETITNTFTVGNVSIVLEESTGDEYKMIPGTVYAKDPKVTVGPTSEACWLFVKVEEVNGLASYIDYAIDVDGDAKWIALDGETGVYYREAVAGNEFYVLSAEDGEDGEGLTLENGHVTVKDTVDQEMLTALEGADAEDLPQLKFTAYAVQKANVNSAAEAWDIATASAQG